MPDGPTLYYSSILDGSTSHYGKKNCSVIFLGGCPLRCPWCYVPSLMTRSSSIPANVDFFVQHFRNQPQAEAVCITGGEPLDQGEAFVELCKALKAEGAAVNVETSGFFPDVLADALPYVDCVGMDVKTVFDVDAYHKITGSKGNPVALLSSVIRSIEAIRKSKWVFSEFRTTVVPGLTDKAEIVDAVSREVSWCDLYVLQQFRPDLELVDGLCQGLPQTPKETLLDLASVAKKHVKNVSIRTVDEGEIPV